MCSILPDLGWKSVFRMIIKQYCAALDSLGLRNGQRIAYELSLLSIPSLTLALISSNT